MIEMFLNYIIINCISGFSYRLYSLIKQVLRMYSWMKIDDVTEEFSDVRQKVSSSFLLSLSCLVFPVLSQIFQNPKEENDKYEKLLHFTKCGKSRIKELVTF